jgi:hypothetical protein
MQRSGMWWWERGVGVVKGKFEEMALTTNK